MKILYDISILGLYWQLLDSKTGIYRVTEELMLKLLCNQELQITLTDLCSQEPALSSVTCQLFVNQRLEKYPCSFIKTCKSHLKLDWLYEFLGKTYFSENFQKLPKYSLQSIPIRGLLKLIEITKLRIYDQYQVLDSEKYDLLHSTYFKLPSEKITQNLPRLLMVHDLIPIKSKQLVTEGLFNYFSDILNSINKDKDWIVCNSEFTRQEFCEYTGMDVNRTFVTHLAADPQFYPVNDPNIIQQSIQVYHIPEKPYFLCLASQLDPRKNIPFLINSFINLITENPNLDINLVLIGTTRLKRPDIENTMTKISQYKDRIIITGYIPDQDLAAIYSGALAFIFPSLYEGFGLPILEAMQCGIPVIASNSTSLPEVVGDAGILISPKDQDQLCQAMLNVLTDSCLRETLQQNGFERTKQFSWQKCADQTVEIYKKIIASR